MEENQIQEVIEETNETITKEDYETVLAELEIVKSKLPKELSDTEKMLVQKEKELWEKEKSIELRNYQLDGFAKFFHAENLDELNNQIKEFQMLLNEVKVSMGYIPSEHKKTDEYTSFEKNKDTKGMIGNKLASLFK